MVTGAVNEICIMWQLKWNKHNEIFFSDSSFSMGSVQCRIFTKFPHLITRILEQSSMKIRLWDNACYLQIFVPKWFVQPSALNPEFFLRAIEIVLRFRWWFYHENPYPNRSSIYLNEFSFFEMNKNTNDSIQFIWRLWVRCAVCRYWYIIWNDKAKYLAGGSSLQLSTPVNFSICHKIKSFITVERALLRMASFPHDTLNLYVLCPVLFNSI